MTVAKMNNTRATNTANVRLPKDKERQELEALRSSIVVQIKAHYGFKNSLSYNVACNRSGSPEKKLYTAIACVLTDQGKEEVEYATSPESSKAALKSLEAQLEKKFSAKSESSTNEPIPCDESCKDVDEEGGVKSGYATVEEKVSVLRQMMIEAALIATDVGKRVGAKLVGDALGVAGSVLSSDYLEF